MERHPGKATLGSAAAAVVAAVALSALLTGCGPEKELPSLPPAEGGPGAQAAKAAPAKSDPDARATIDSAVKALTGGKPELISKGKFCRYVLKGHMYAGENASQQVETTRTVTAAWPDRLHFVNDGELFGNKLLIESWLKRPEFVVARNGTEFRPANPAEWEQNLATDAVGQVWLPFLLPAADPKAVVFDPQTVSLERRDLRLVKLALGEHPVYQLYFDAKTDALVRAEYTVTEAGVTRRTAVLFADHKPGPDGFVLPRRTECLHNKSLVERWAVETWEMPDGIKDEEFVPKRK